MHCGRCKSTFENREALRVHLETCLWKCEICTIYKAKNPTKIGKHRNNCGKDKKSTEESPGI